jgi:hypothetical protein
MECTVCVESAALEKRPPIAVTDSDRHELSELIVVTDSDRLGLSGLIVAIGPGRVEPSELIAATDPGRTGLAELTAEIDSARSELTWRTVVTGSDISLHLVRPRSRVVGAACSPVVPLQSTTRSVCSAYWASRSVADGSWEPERMH